MKKSKFHFLPIIFCLALLVSVALPAVPVMAADQEVEKIPITYEFTCYTDFSHWDEYAFYGYDIDFVTYIVEDISGSMPSYELYFIALSDDAFTYDRFSYYLKNGEGEPLLSGANTGLKAMSVTQDGHTIYQFNAHGTIEDLKDVWGYPNVRYVLKNDFDLESVYSEFITNGGIDWESSTFASVYDDSLPIIDSLSYKVLSGTECHGDATINSCFQLSWKSSGKLLADDVLQVKVLLDYNYSTYWSVKRKYGSGFFDFSQIYGYIPVSNKSEVFCVTDFVDFLKMENVNGFTILPQKIYLRVVRGSTYGDWVVYDVNRDILNTPKIGSGEIISGETEFDDFGDYDSESKGTIEAPEKDSGFGFLGFDFSDLSSVFNSFVGIINSLISALGSFPTMFAAVFSFLPAPILNSFLLVFVLAIIIGVVKIFT